MKRVIFQLPSGCRAKISMPGSTDTVPTPALADRQGPDQPHHRDLAPHPNLLDVERILIVPRAIRQRALQQIAQRGVVALRHAAHVGAQIGREQPAHLVGAPGVEIVRPLRQRGSDIRCRVGGGGDGGVNDFKKRDEEKDDWAIEPGHGGSVMPKACLNLQNLHLFLRTQPCLCLTTRRLLVHLAK